MRPGALFSSTPAPGSFRDVVVAPTQEVLKSPAGAFFRGGPVWPHWSRQIVARQCHGIVPIPRDEPPWRVAAPAETRDAGIWCGPICWHYGHTVADFGMRVAASVAAFPDDRTPLVFSAWEDAAMHPSPFFWEMLDHLGVGRGRVLLVREPVRFRTLHVLPQSERRWGGGPSRSHLDRMDASTGDAASVRKDVPQLYVSRAALSTGRLAGEAYLERALDALGVRVLRPETIALAEQIALYRRAASLVFAEGSAVHTLQLLGRLGADVAVLTRRPWARMARSSLAPRARNLRYLDALRGIVYGRRASGQRYQVRGISVLDGPALIGRFAAVGVPLAESWDAAAFAAQRDADIASWMDHTRSLALHPKAIATAEDCLRRLKL